MRRHAIALSMLVVAADCAVAGPLNPPAGPVASTGKTIAEVEPRTAISTLNTPGDSICLFKITQPGSYYLTGTIQGVANKYGILIEADNVTLDLNGFSLLGVASSETGIVVNPSTNSRITIRNGTVRGWGGSGIDAFRNNALIENIAATHNGGTGIYTSNGARVVNCTASSNGTRGMEIGNDSIITGCVANSNVGDNTDAGIYAGDRCVLSQCSAAWNAPGYGIAAGEGSRLTECQAGHNGEGIHGYRNLTVAGCVTSGNTTDGISIGDAGTVRDCQATDNGDDGIQVGNRCTVIGNTCDSNGESSAGAGVFITGVGCRVEDNSVGYNRYGILTASGTATDNFIAKNTARGNAGANFNVNPGNEFAPVVTNPGASSFSAMTPWSNVAF